MNYLSLLSLQPFLLGWKEGKEKATLGIIHVEEERKELWNQWIGIDVEQSHHHLKEMESSWTMLMETQQENRRLEWKRPKF